MKLIIDIPEEIHKALEQGSFGVKYNMYDLVGCILNGTPLPKGHGRLIDEDTVDTFDDEMVQALANAPTIIEADKEAEND